nr:hypothetical protein B0A51_16347 [Rachicladosporium sp. CCFEE 5018]
MAETSINGSPKKPWVMNAFAMTAPGHLAPGLWRHPAQEKQTLSHWVNLAKFLDDNGFHALFFADVLGIYDVYKASDGPALKSAAQVPILDISLLVSAMAHATKNISFGITASTTYENPYALARRFATLDHITDGRVGFNIVTSYLHSAAMSFGLEKAVEHDERYAIADEFMEVFYKLLEGSWQADAVVGDKATGIWTDPSKVRKINHVGKYFRCAGPSLVDPQDTRTILRELGRPEDSIKFIAGIFIVVDETDERAQAKFNDMLQYADLEGTAALFGGWSGTDLSTFSDDEDFKFAGAPAIQSMINSWTETVPGTKDTKWTKKLVLQHLAISGAHERAIGSPTTVANILQKWVDEAQIDGFNISYATTPGTFEDIVKYLWPELRKRGVLQERYAGSSMRENYLADGGGPKVRSWHPASRYTWQAQAQSTAVSL